MKFSGGLPGQSRKDKSVTDRVKAAEHLGQDSGKWIKDLWKKDAMKDIKTKLNEARDYHNTVTLPFGVKGDDDGDDTAAPPIAGIGILPAAMIKEYTDKMRDFGSQLTVLVDQFLANPQEHIDWAVKEHNGTFDPSNYPGCKENEPMIAAMNGQKYLLDADKFRSVMRKKFYIRTEPLPVPNSSQFCEAVSALLGNDAESVNIRVRDASQEAQRELLRRMMDPVMHMAAKLGNQVCHCRNCNGKASKTANFKDTLVNNVKEIAGLVPKMNLGGDPELDKFAVEMEALTRYSPDKLRDDDATRTEAAQKAAEMVKRLSGYKL